ncbi:hypothetical protein V8J88_03520 [Massilia sp. W12]|uniref:hypothetical protein n=1 Tax=Massilia sp. W12 TaxID=3126507 RepID=UPI0030D04FD1
MLTLQKNLSIEHSEQALPALTLRFSYPQWTYSLPPAAGVAPSRTPGSLQTLLQSQQSGARQYQISLPSADLLGQQASACAAYMQYVLCAQNPDVDQLALQIQVQFDDADSGATLGEQSLHALLMPRQSAAVVLCGQGQARGAQLAPQDFYLLSRTGYEALHAGFSSITGCAQSGVFIWLLREMLDYVPQGAYVPDVLPAKLLARCKAVLRAQGARQIEAALDLLQNRFDILFDFSLCFSPSRMLDIAGRLQVVNLDGAPALSREALRRYQISVEYLSPDAQQAGSFQAVELDWDAQSGSAGKSGIAFAFGPTCPVPSHVQTLLHVQVKAPDGALVWSQSFQKDDPALRSLLIVCFQPQASLSAADSTRKAESAPLCV